MLFPIDTKLKSVFISAQCIMWVLSLPMIFTDYDGKHAFECPKDVQYRDWNRDRKGYDKEIQELN